MARLPRYEVPDQPQHIIQRGNNRGAIFFADQDYQFFLECMQSACEQYGADIHAYVLMTNHVHLLASPHATGSIGKLMQSVGRRYVQHVNRIHHRTGSLWEGRYRATPIDTERYLLTCYRYIELNPVRAGMVQRPAEYRWSSHTRHAHDRPDPLVSEHPSYLDLGRTTEERCRAYRALFDVDLDEQTLSDLRSATHKGWALGGDRFREQIAAASRRRATPAPRGGKRPGAGRRATSEESS